MKKFIRIFQSFYLVAICASYPENNRITITEDFFPDELAVYEGKYDIIKLLVPLKYDRKEDNNDDNNENGNSLTVFFIEGDQDNDDNIKYKGLYVLKHGKATKLLNNGKDITASNDYSKEVFFGADDGIYKYNEEENRAEKFGLVNDSIVGLVREFHSDVMYILTEDHYVYRVNDDGNVKTIVNEIGKANQIALDYFNNLYYYGKNRQPYVYDGNSTTKIVGLPKKPYYVNLIRPSFAIEEGVLFIADNEMYILYPNGTSEPIGVEFEVRPTAYAMESTLIQYYAYSKKIYEYNLLSVYINNIIGEFSRSVEDKYYMLDFIKKVGRSFPTNPIREN